MDIVEIFRKYSRMILYVLLTSISFYCACYRLPVGLKYGVNLVVFAWACMEFFIRPNFDRAMFCARFLALFFFPYLVFWMWSVGIWISELQAFDFIVRGSQNIIYMLTNLLFVASAVYLFGAKTMNYTIIGMAAANGFVAVQVAISGGIPTFIQQYIQLLLTFADETGGLMRSMELHDMVYGWGACVIYYMIHKEKTWVHQIFCLAVSLFFFTVGFKRIAMPAVAGAVFLFYLLCYWKPRHLRFWASACAVITGVLLFLYLVSIKTHLFFELADKYEIDLMSRDVIFSYYENFYTLAPTYLGRGIRFIYAYGTEHANDSVMVNAVHNVYLEFYIEVGFWCWWFWMLYELAFRVHRIQERFDAVAAYALMAMNVYLFFTYLTDNTSFYFPPNVMYRIVIMVWCLEWKEKNALIFAKPDGQTGEQVLQENAGQSTE